MWEPSYNRSGSIQLQLTLLHKYLLREPYDNGSNVAAGIFEHMLVDPGGPAPMLRLSMPPAPRYVYPVCVICKERQNCIRVMFVPGIAIISDNLADRTFVGLNCRRRDLSDSYQAGKE
jgi:hypothetical protein